MTIEQSAAILLLGVFIGCAAMHYLWKQRMKEKAMRSRAIVIDDRIAVLHARAKEAKRKKQKSSHYESEAFKLRTEALFREVA